MKNGAVSYVTCDTAPFFYKAFATIKSIYSLYFNVSLNAKPFVYLANLEYPFFGNLNFPTLLVCSIYIH